MKNEKRIIVSLLMVLVLALSLLATGCQKKVKGGDATPEPPEVNVVMTLDLNSDSANDVTWEFVQEDEIFSCEDTFLQDEGSENGSGELQSFELKPIRAGSTTLRFINQAQKTAYIYDVVVSDDMTDISIKNSRGESGGTDVEAPEPVIEKN